MPVPPKPAHLRQRTNRVSTAATLSEASPRRTVPALPEGIEWHPLTLDFWRRTWRSPMASEFLDSDRPGLVMLAHLVNTYWTKPSTKLASEIRQQEARFGLSPLDRRRLQWEVERGETAERKRTARQPTPADAGDARSVLRALS